MSCVSVCLCVFSPLSLPPSLLFFLLTYAARVTPFLHERHDADMSWQQTLSFVAPRPPSVEQPCVVGVRLQYAARVRPFLHERHDAVMASQQTLSFEAAQFAPSTSFFAVVLSSQQPCRVPAQPPTATVGDTVGGRRRRWRGCGREKSSCGCKYRVTRGA